MKKTARWLAMILCSVIILTLATDLALRSLLPMESVRLFLLTKGKEFVNREIKAEKISAGILGLRLRNVAIASSADGLEKGSLLEAEEVWVRFSLLHLLHGHVKVYAIRVKGLNLHIIRNMDGTFNFDGIVTSGQPLAEPAPGEEAGPLYLTIQGLLIKDGTVTFVDNAEGTKAQLSDIFVSVDKFHFDRPFPMSANMVLSYSQPGIPEIIVPIGATMTTNLANLDLAKASAQLKLLVLKHSGGIFIGRGKINNFENPSLELSMDMKLLSERLVSDYIKEVPAFSIPEANLYLKVSANLIDQTADISSLRLKALDSSFAASGDVWFGKVPPSFQMSSSFDLELAPLAKAVPMLASLRPVGRITGTSDFTEKTVEASVNLYGVGVKTLQAGNLSDFNARIDVKSIKQITLRQFSGKLNNEPFNGKASFLQNKDSADINFELFADRLALPTLSAEMERELAAGSAGSAVSTEPGSAAQPWPLPPLNIKAKFEVASLDVPFFFGTDLVFNADLKGITPDLSGAHGTLLLSTGRGEIKDIYKLADANALTKTLFVSLGVVSRVINSLNVFAVLGGIGTGVLSAVTGNEKVQPTDMVVQTIKGPDGELMQVWVPYTDRKIEGQMYFDKFETAVNFDKGVATIKRGSFVSDMLSFRLDGKTNFKTQKIAMTVHAAPGKHEVEGIMPLVLSIAGTVDQPQGSMSVFSSISSVLTEPVTNNFVSNSLKKGVGGIVGLFKKKNTDSLAPLASPLPEENGSEPAVSESVPALAAENTMNLLPDLAVPAQPLPAEHMPEAEPEAVPMATESASAAIPAVS